MLRISELMVNLCDFRGTVCESDFREKWEKIRKEAEKTGNKKVNGVYFGFEFCANMLVHLKEEVLLDSIRWIKQQGYSVTWVLPPLHERYIQHYKCFLEKLFINVEIDACVVNDLGTLYMLRNELRWDKEVILGRMFDKSVRELRFDVHEDSKLKEQRETYFMPGVYSQVMTGIAEKYQVDMFETDTLPDGVLQTEEWGTKWKVGIHYPRIYLSRPAYCEYDTAGNGSNKQFLFETVCRGKCRVYEKEISAEGKKSMFKQGLSICGYQQKPIEEVVTGKIRLIYSRG